MYSLRISLDISFVDLHVRISGDFFTISGQCINVLNYKPELTESSRKRPPTPWNGTIVVIRAIFN